MVALVFGVVLMPVDVMARKIGLGKAKVFAKLIGVKIKTGNISGWTICQGM